MEQGKQSPVRYHLLDELRGLNLINMVVYHGLWDLVFLYGVRADWYLGLPGKIWQVSGCCLFILLSGFCVPFGRHTARRGAQVFGAGALVTLATWLFVPETLVLFGVLTMLGSAMLLTAALRPLFEKVPAGVGFGASLALFLVTYNVNMGGLGFESWWLMTLPRGLYANLFTAFLGFPQPGFYSTDYFSLIPWVFLFWAGYFLHRLVGRARMEPLRRSVCPPLGWLGRHSLIFYLLHQPVVFGVLYLFFSLRG